MTENSLKEVYQYALESALRCTNSDLGYFALVDDSESSYTVQVWSTSVMELCKLKDKSIVFNIDEHNMWYDAIKNKRDFLLLNDCSHLDVPNSHVKIFRYAGIPLRDNITNKTVALIGVANKNTDYTELDIKKLYTLLAAVWQHLAFSQYLDALEKVVEERTSNLIKTNKQLQQSNEELMQFAYVASHDLKSPLRAIYNLASWIEEDIQEGKPVTHHVSLLQNRTKRMEALIDALLDYSRIGRTDIENNTVDVHKIIEDVSMNLDVPIWICTNMPILSINKLRIYQVFANLVSNSIKHYDKPGHPMIKVICEEFEHHYRFEVQDDGPGIDRQYHEKIFEIFQTLKTNEGNNTGMGLTIVKKIIEHYGGRIWVESEKGNGARFVFDLPK